AGPANDATGDKQAFGQLGKGALVRILDASLVTNRALTEFILDTAETHNIPYQYFVSNGATDAGKVHLYGTGVPTAALAICSRYHHSSASIIHVYAYTAAKKLLVRLVFATDQSTLYTIVRFD